MTVQVVREHKRITDEIDDMYITAINSAVHLRTFMVRPKGANMKEYFLIFFSSFYALYLHTSDLPGMEDFSKKPMIWRWFSLQGPISTRRIEVGLDLFSEYKTELLAKAIVSVTR